MACNCGKRNPDGTRQVRGHREVAVPQELARMTFYAVSPSGEEHPFSTLREARDFGRKSIGNGWKVEGRRD